MKKRLKYGWMHMLYQCGVAYNPFLKVKGRNIPQASFLAVLVPLNFGDCNSNSTGQWGIQALGCEPLWFIPSVLVKN